MDTINDISRPLYCSNPREFGIGTLAESATTFAEAYIDRTALPLQSDYPRQRHPNCGLAYELLGGEYTTDLRDGLARSIEYGELLLDVGQRPCGQRRL